MNSLNFSTIAGQPTLGKTFENTFLAMFALFGVFMFAKVWRMQSALRELIDVYNNLRFTQYVSNHLAAVYAMPDSRHVNQFIAYSNQRNMWRLKTFSGRVSRQLLTICVFCVSGENISNTKTNWYETAPNCYWIINHNIQLAGNADKKCVYSLFTELLLSSQPRRTFFRDPRRTLTSQQIWYSTILLLTIDLETPEVLLFSFKLWFI